MKKRFIVIGALAAAFGAFSAYSAMQGFVVQRYELDSDKITEPVDIMLISDLHGCWYGENQQELIEAIDGENPDLIALAGDIFDDENPNEGTVVLLSQISAKYPCYYVVGNHEVYTGETDKLKALAAEAGVTVLSGETAYIDVNGQRISISGVDDPNMGQVEWEYQLKLTDTRRDGFSLLISHRPEAVEEYNKYGFDLILSGHAHGGQWRIPGILNGLVAPNQGLFPKYAGGEYQLQNGTMIVSRGLERNWIPRYFNPPELVVIRVG